jgi:hypothetical protein
MKKLTKILAESAVDAVGIGTIAYFLDATMMALKDNHRVFEEMQNPFVVGLGIGTAVGTFLYRSVRRYLSSR